MTKEKANIYNIIQAAEHNVRVPLPSHLKKIKNKPKTKTQFRYSFSTFYNSNFVVSRAYPKIIHMPFKNSFNNE